MGISAISFHKYPDFVVRDKIMITESAGKRYSLTIPFANNQCGKKICVILKNPSRATATGSDRTINRVLNYIYSKGYGTVCILNLFPFYSTQSRNVLPFYSNPSFQNVMAQNIATIRKECSGQEVILAWGTDTISMSRSLSNQNHQIYNKTVSRVTNLVTKCASQLYYVDRCHSQSFKCACPCPNQCKIRYPLHGLRWKQKSVMFPY